MREAGEREMVMGKLLFSLCALCVICATCVRAAEVGRSAPQFKADAVMPTDNQFKEIKLSDYLGKYVVLFFYPLDFTFVCPTEIVAFSDRCVESIHTHTHTHTYIYIYIYIYIYL